MASGTASGETEGFLNLKNQKCVTDWTGWCRVRALNGASRQTVVLMTTLVLYLIIQESKPS